MEGGSESRFRMFDVDGRPDTFRVATAQGVFRGSEDVIRAIVERRLPKGDAIALAEVAGLLAVKLVPQQIPLCHNIPIGSVRIRCEPSIENGTIVVTATVSTRARTGVEIEAMAAVQAALLCVYDLTKSLSPRSLLDGVHLVEKTGGRHGHWHVIGGHRTETGGPVRVALVTVSDRAHAGTRVDESGPAMEAVCRAAGFDVRRKSVVPDDPGRIAGAVRESQLEAGGCDLLVFSGGTGAGPRDVTPESVRPLLDCELPGFGELARSEGALETKRSWLSRCGAGFAGSMLVVMVPGSPRGATSTLETLIPLIRHALAVRLGGGHDDKPGRSH